MLWVLIRSASLRLFYWVPITYDLVEKLEKYQYFWTEKRILWRPMSGSALFVIKYVILYQQNLDQVII